MSGRGHQMELMVSAITVGDLELVEDLLVGGVPVNANHRTPLSTAVREGQIEIADFLIRNGADINSGSQFFESALIIASRECNLPMIDLLLNAGASINGDDYSKMPYSTPMHVAATKENIDLLNLLVASEAELNLRNYKHETPLHLAAYSGHPKNIARLISCGAHHDLVDHQGNTALHLAISEGHWQSVRQLCKLGCSVNLPTTNGCTPLMLAVKKTRLEVLKALLQFEPCINRTEDILERTVAHVVVEVCPHRIRRRSGISVNKEIEMMESLVQAGVDLNLSDKNLDTPLHLCVKTGCDSLLEYLIKSKHINVNTRNLAGHSPLLTACSIPENHGMIKLLTQYCPLLVKHETIPGEPLHGLMLELAENSNQICMKLLLEAGYRCSHVEADLCRENHEKSTTIVTFVDEHLLQPFPLQRICRTAVRDALETQLHRKIFSLPVPQKIRDMIILQDIFIPS